MELSCISEGRGRELNLGNIFKRDNQNIKTEQSVKAAESMSRGERVYRMQSGIRNLVPGQTIRGSVVSRDGTSVQIALRQNMLINARIDQSINLALGQSMSFEVKANNGSVLSLSPLYANMANEATIMRALGAAGLPETANNIEMVAVMMEEGMPIDRESLSNISRLLMEFPKQDPASLIQMSRLGLPVTEESIGQFELYRSANHQLLGTAETIMGELPDVFHELLGEGRTDAAYTFYRNVLDIFTADQTEGAVIQKDAESMLPGNDAANAEETRVITGDGILTVTPETVGAEEGAVPSETAGAVNIEDTAQKTQEGQEAQTEQSAQAGWQTAILTGRQWNALGDLLKELGVEEDKAQQVRDGGLTPREVLTLIRESMPRAAAGGNHARVMERLLGGKEFETLLKSEAARQWMIEPKEVSDPHKVEQLYERIREQSARLNEALQAADKLDAPVAKSVQNLQSNVDFMNQLNHMFTYIQLPLKMAGNHAHGDLYVYTNKKNLAAKDGNVSALLHLDMEHLGPLDVYVAMQHNRVSTNFTLQDESALDLIAQHISLLDERLAGRGYDLKAQFQVKEEAKEDSGIMQTILEQGKNISVLSRTSFDMRA